MSIRVVQGPAPIVLPSELAGVDVDDLTAAAIIAAVTAELDGPHGKLGRCFGAQTLEADFRPACHIDLPCPPVLEVVSVSFSSESGLVIAEGGDYFLEAGRLTFRDGSFWGAVPSDRKIQVRYRAGYDGAADGTGPMPPQIKQAIILKARLIASSLGQDGNLRAEEVEGIGRREFALPDQVNTVIERAVDNLVAGLKVHAL